MVIQLDFVKISLQDSILKIVRWHNDTVAVLVLVHTETVDTQTLQEMLDAVITFC